MTDKTEELLNITETEIIGTDKSVSLDAAMDLRKEFPKFPFPLMVFDVETTGLDPVKFDICQIGAVFLDENLEEKAGLYRLCRPFSNIFSTSAMAVHQIPEEKILKDGIGFKIVAAELADLINKMPECVPVAWGPNFDISFLKESYKKANTNWPFKNHEIFDLKSIALFELIKMGYKADYSRGNGVEFVLKALGLEFDGQPHDALADAKNEARILRKLFGLSA